MDDLEFERRRRLSRRRMGQIAFAAFIGEAVALMVGVFVGGPLFAANVAAVAPVLTGLVWAQVAFIGAYLGVSLTEAMKK